MRLHLCELSVNVELTRKPSLADTNYTATCRWREAFEPDSAKGLTNPMRHSVTMCADQTTVIAGKDRQEGRDERLNLWRADRTVQHCCDDMIDRRGRLGRDLRSVLRRSHITHFSLSPW